MANDSRVPPAFHRGQLLYAKDMRALSDMIVRRITGGKGINARTFNGQVIIDCKPQINTVVDEAKIVKGVVKSYSSHAASPLYIMDVYSTAEITEGQVPLFTDVQVYQYPHPSFYGYATGAQVNLTRVRGRYIIV